MAKIKLDNDIVVEGDLLSGTVELKPQRNDDEPVPDWFIWTVFIDGKPKQVGQSSKQDFSINTIGMPAGHHELRVALSASGKELHHESKDATCHFTIRESDKLTALRSVGQSLQTISRRMPEIGQAMPVSIRNSNDEALRQDQLWTVIRNRTQNLSFDRYQSFIDRVLCQQVEIQGKVELLGGRDAELRGGRARQLLAVGTDAYDLLEVATDIFLLLESGTQLRPSIVDLNDNDAQESDQHFLAEEQNRLGMSWDEIKVRIERYLGERNRLPYLDRISRALQSANDRAGIGDHPFCDSLLLNGRIDAPCMIELIWSYFHEEAMLVQTMNAISLRFQNRRSDRLPNPMNTLNISSLRPLNNFIWGYIQGEQNRLSLQRRNYEYDHHYGLCVIGRAAASIDSVDSRSRFLEAFNRLLQTCSIYYQERSNTLVNPDPFPLLNAAREVHMLLAEGSGNQYGDLPWAARREMLMMQWILARPEMSHFLNVGETIPYAEAWMNPVDAVKKMQGWTSVSASHFNTLAVFGERLLLSLRHDRWHDPAMSPSYAAGWAQYFRTEIQGYIHSYHVATGVDLSSRGAVDAVLPAVHFRNRLAQQSVKMNARNERIEQK